MIAPEDPLKASGNMTSKKHNRAVAESVESLSIHGLPKLIAASSFWRRLGWLICCIAAFGFFVYFTVDIIRMYQCNATYFKTEKVTKTTMKLPAFTFCNTNHFDAYIKDKDAPKLEKMPHNCSHEDFANEKSKRYFKSACKTFMGMSKHNSIFANLSKYIKFPDMFSFVPNYWPCFTMNRNATLVQLEPSEHYGIRMLLFFNESDYSDDGFSQNVSTHLHDVRQGIYIDIHDPAEHLHQLQGITLPTGYHTHIALRRTNTTRKAAPFRSNCYNDEEESYTKVITGKHLVSNCFYSCALLAIYNTCGNIPAYLKAFMPEDKYPPIQNISENLMQNCSRNATRNKTVENCGCRMPCKQITYETKVIQNPWPQSWQTNYLRPVLSEMINIPEAQIDVAMLKKYLIFVSIYYDDFTETVITEKEFYELSKIVSDFGGQMGMFLGASFLSLIEIICLLLSLVYGWWVRRKKKKQQIVNSE